MLKVIRAKRGMYVPCDPENPDNNAMRLVQSGLIAIVPEDFVLLEDTYTTVGKVELDINKKQTKQKQG